MDINPQACSVVVEMVSQMGMKSVSGFKNFLDALEEGNYDKAAQEMRDSRWGKQTPKIADTLAKKNEFCELVLAISNLTYPFWVNPLCLSLNWVNLFS